MHRLLKEKAIAPTCYVHPHSCAFLILSLIHLRTFSHGPLRRRFRRGILKGCQHYFPSRDSCSEEMSLVENEMHISGYTIIPQAGPAVNAYHIPSTEPLKLGTWLRYFRRPIRNSGLVQSFTQYCARRGIVNAVNSKSGFLPLHSSSRVSMLICSISTDQALSSVSNQIFNDQSNTVRYYLD